MGSFEPTFSYSKGSSLFCITIIVLTNRYGHPHEETLERLGAAGTTVYRTDQSGAIIVNVDGNCMKIREYVKAQGMKMLIYNV